MKKKRFTTSIFMEAAIVARETYFSEGIMFKRTAMFERIKGVGTILLVLALGGLLADAATKQAYDRSAMVWWTLPDWQLRAAISTGDAAGVRRALARGAAVEGETNWAPPLAQAAVLNQPDVLRILLEAGADPSRAQGVMTPLAFAVGKHRCENVELLLAAGARIDQPAEGHDLLLALVEDLAEYNHACDDNEADRQACLRLIHSLLKAGADPCRVYPHKAISPLELARLANLSLVVQWFEQAEASKVY